MNRVVWLVHGGRGTSVLYVVPIESQNGNMEPADKIWHKTFDPQEDVLEDPECGAQLSGSALHYMKRTHRPSTKP